MMPFHSTSAHEMPMMTLHLWHHALSNMALPECVFSLHSLLELPTTDGDGTLHAPHFVAHWQVTLLAPVIRSLLDSLSDDYDLPATNLVALVAILNDAVQCADSFAVRLRIAPSRIIHHTEMLKMLYALHDSNASIDCSIHFKGAAATAFRSIVNHIVDNTSFYMPPTSDPPPPYNG
jgi:hypothetical protein